MAENKKGKAEEKKGEEGGLLGSPFNFQSLDMRLLPIISSMREEDLKGAMATAYFLQRFLGEKDMGGKRLNEAGGYVTILKRDKQGNIVEIIEKPLKGPVEEEEKDESKD